MAMVSLTRSEFFIGDRYLDVYLGRTDPYIEAVRLLLGNRDAVTFTVNYGAPRSGVGTPNEHLGVEYFRQSHEER